MIYYIYTSYNNNNYLVLHPNINYYLSTLEERPSNIRNVSLLFVSMENLKSYFKQNNYNTIDFKEQDFIIHKDNLYQLL